MSRRLGSNYCRTYLCATTVVGGPAPCCYCTGKYIPSVMQGTTIRTISIATAADGGIRWIARSFVGEGRKSTRIPREARVFTKARDAAT